MRLSVANGCVKLIDFERTAAADGLAWDGPPIYCAPEQIATHNGNARAGDIYPLGTITFEMVTGRWPFKATL
jgi:serine/threonine protein kinase